MKLEEAIVSMIQTAGLGTVGVSLFHSHMPAQVLNGVLVMTRVPIANDPYSGLRKGPFQVVVRSQDLEEAHNKASQIMKALTTDGVTVGEVSFLFIKPAHEPLVFPRTEGSLFEASVNYNFAANWE